MSKYEPLWRFLQNDGSDCLQLSFDRMKEILDFEIDHSFLNYKKEAAEYGYTVEKISMKECWIRFLRATTD